MCCVIIIDYSVPHNDLFIDNDWQVSVMKSFHFTLFVEVLIMKHLYCFSVSARILFCVSEIHWCVCVCVLQGRERVGRWN